VHLPNLFNSVITEALEKPGATAESVAAAIASSKLFLRAVQLGMANVTNPGEFPGTPPGEPTTEHIAHVTRARLEQAFSSPTAGTMFPRTEDERDIP
jgi:hypothetical protein